MSFLAKLKLDAQKPVVVMDIPDQLPLPAAGWQIQPILLPQTSQMLLFAKNKSDLDYWVPQMVAAATPEARLWVAYPKKSGALASDLTRDEGWVVMETFGYVGVMNVAIDENWSALRFKPAAAMKKMVRATPMEARQTEGIDYMQRKITQLPADVEQALAAMPGMTACFHALSFSHKREHLEAIADAKRPETRARRIEKMIAMMAQHMANKKP